jgi:hypothetical protein
MTPRAVRGCRSDPARVTHVRTVGVVRRRSGEQNGALRDRAFLRTSGSKYDRPRHPNVPIAVCRTGAHHGAPTAPRPISRC